MHHHPVRIVFEEGGLSNIGKIAKEYGKKAILVTTIELKKLGISEKVATYLKKEGISVRMFEDIAGEPSSQDINKVSQRYKRFKSDVIIGLGGGSSIDFAKSLAITLSHNVDIWKCVSMGGKVLFPPTEKTLPIIAIPTTAGSGSEVTPYAVVKNLNVDKKATIKSLHIYPRTALIDPRLATTLPPLVTAYTAMDALAHAIECFLNVTKKTPFSELLSLEAIRLIVKNSVLAYENGKNVEARKSLALASVMAGICLSQAGTTVAHALSESLTGYVSIPHGIAVSLFLPSVLEETYSSYSDGFSKMSNALGEKSPRAVIDVYKKTLQSLNVLEKANKLNITPEIAKKVAEDTTSGYKSAPLRLHPKVFSYEEMLDICQPKRWTELVKV